MTGPYSTAAFCIFMHLSYWQHSIQSNPIYSFVRSKVKVIESHKFHAQNALQLTDERQQQYIEYKTRSWTVEEKPLDGPLSMKGQEGLVVPRPQSRKLQASWKLENRRRWGQWGGRSDWRLEQTRRILVILLGLRFNTNTHR